MEGGDSAAGLPPDYEAKAEVVLGRLMYPSSGGGGRGRGGGNWLNGGTNWTVDYPRGDRTFAIAIRRSEILPSWLGVFGYVAAVAALLSVVFFTMIVWLLWIAVASVTLFLRTRQAAAPRSAPAPAA